MYYRAWLQHLRRLCEEYERTPRQMCCSLTPKLHHLQNQTVALYRPEQKKKRKEKKHNENAINFGP